MKTPCKKICKVDGGICVGCKRTLSEIKKWNAITDKERDDIMREIKMRK